MLERYGEPRHYRDGEVIFRRGTPGGEMYVIHSGKVQISTSDGGPAETTLAVLGPRDFFGEMSLLTGDPRSASAKAMGDVEVSVIDRVTFDHLIADPLIREILIRMSHRIRDVNRELEKLATQDVVRRETLSHLVEQRRWFS